MANHLDTAVNSPKQFRAAPRDKLNVLVYAPFRTYFDGLADSVTSKMLREFLIYCHCIIVL